jgi:CRP/FNR family transcriptional regulator
VCSFSPYCCSSLAFEGDAVVVSVPRRDLLGLLERSAGASRAFLREVTAREARLARRVEELAGGQVERRVAMLLLRLAEQTGRPADDGSGTLIPIQFSRQDLADLVGTTLETAIRVMARLGREGVVHTLPRGLRVGDRRRLEEIARGAAAPR